MGGSFKPGDEVSYYGGEGTVVEVEGNVLKVATPDGTIVSTRADLPMVSKTYNYESGERVSFPGGEGEIIKIEERSDRSDLLWVHTADGDLKKVPADKKGLEPQADLSDLLRTGRFDTPHRFRLRRDAARFDLAYRFDRFLSLQGSRIDISPHQVKAAHRVLTSHDYRFLIADEVGLGKTIEAGIIIEELIARGRIERVLIVTPASLQHQWQAEMNDKFDRQYVIYNRNYLNNVRAEGSRWYNDEFVITSIDFAKQDDIREELAETHWDMVVFDESHHLTAREGSDGSVNRTDRYRLGEVVAENTDGLLFLTGTPHKGKSDQFYYMISLLDKYRFENKEDITPEKLEDLMIRRLKSNPNMVHTDGSSMFPPKHIETLPVDFSEVERDLYDDITTYLTENYRLGMDQDHRAAGFSLVLYQKRLVSSIRAIQKSLQRHAKHIRRGGADNDLDQLTIKLLERFRQRPDSLTEKQREKIEREVEKQSLAQSKEDMAVELEVLDDLIQRAKNIKVDSKGRKLQEFIGKIHRNDPNEKVLIFTEYTDTLNYLNEEVFPDREFAIIHGGMSQTRRREELERFRDDVEIMLATDAAREGINLQFAHIMVNYDLPWNPIRIDQRMGRLHRYGQDQPVHIYNLFVRDSRENQILEQLVSKLDQIEEDVGLSSDVLGLVLDDSEFDLEERIMRAVASNEKVEDVVADMDEVIEEQKEAVKTIQDRFLIRDQFDEVELEEVQELIKDSRSDNVGQDEIKRMVELFIDEIGGEISERTDLDQAGIYRIDVTDILTLDEDIRSTYRLATFDQEIAIDNEQTDFFALNHPVVQGIIDYCIDGEWVDGRSTVLQSPDEDIDPGILFNVSIGCEAGDGTVEAEEFIELYATPNPPETKEVPQVLENSSVPDSKNHPEVETVVRNCDHLFDLAKETAQNKAEDMATEAEEDRAQDVAVKREHARRHFENAIETWENRLETYQRQQREGMEMTGNISRAENELERLRRERAQEMQRLDEEETMFPLSPQIINVAIVVTGL